MIPHLVTEGDPRHGVVVHARRLARAVGADGPDDGPCHVQFTDRLWGASPEEAAARVEAFPVPFTASLHDLPQASDGPRNLVRRTAAYMRVAVAARGVVVSSEHEAALLRVVAPGVAPAIIPLPIASPPRAPRDALTPEVAVLGFFYPGKGHAEVVAAVAALGGEVGVTVLGRASPGHEDELSALRQDAAARGVEVSVAGYLEEAELLASCRRVAVPVAAHQHVSASGSVGSWISAGRRPLVPVGSFAREQAALRPGTLTLYADLPEAIARALEEPGTTWLGEDAVTRPDWEDAAAAHVAFWAGVRW